MLNYTLGTIEASEALIKDLYSGSKISRNHWLFEPKCRNNAEITYILLPCIAIY